MPSAPRLVQFAVPLGLTAALATLLSALLTALLAGCGGTQESEPRSDRTITVSLPPEPPGIFLSFVQQRFDEGTRKAAITLINRSDHAVRVRRVGLDWPGYPGAPRRFRYVVPAGLTVDLRYRLPDPDCDRAHLAATPHAVVVTRTGTIRRELDGAGKRFLRRIWQMSCDQALLRRTARIQYAGPWRERIDRQRAVLHGSLLLRRLEGRPGGGAAVSVTQIQGSPLFDLAVRTPNELRPGRRRTAVPLTVVTGGRCDEHSRAAVTTPFTFRVWLQIDGRPVTVIAEPDQRAQVRMYAFLDRVCARRTGG